MRFGARLQADSSTRFDIWAPGVDQLALAIGQDLRPMQAAGDGWFTTTQPDLPAGTAYRFALPDGTLVPDPASRAQAGGPEGPSLVTDPASYHWRQAEWRGRPFTEAVILEVHAGAIAAPGGFAAIQAQLDRLAAQGFTAIEIMPVADFVGRRGWGYDGVLPYAPASIYGTPDDLKALVDAAHERRMMVFLDVVYNHFGPAGNYLHSYAEPFFTDRHQTPWGKAIDFTRPEVRAFFRENAIYWLDEFRMDGLRFDAVHAIKDDESEVHFLTEMAQAIRQRFPDRHVHLMLENEHNQAFRLLGHEADEALFDGQWADDIHNASHVVMTGETDGYYEDYEEEPAAKLARGLTEGFVYQGEVSKHKGEPRGEPSAHLAPQHFIYFLQNHDQIGNRALGDRLAGAVPARTLEVMTALLLLAPTTPMMFMGEEWGAENPFPFFCDFEGELADAVRKGRAQEFAHFKSWAGGELPDALSASTFESAVLAPPASENGRARLVKELIALRQKHVVPFLEAMGPRQARPAVARVDGALLDLTWFTEGGMELRIVVHVAEDRAPALAHPLHEPFYESQPELAAGFQAGVTGWCLAASLKGEAA